MASSKLSKDGTGEKCVGTYGKNSVTVELYYTARSIWFKVLEKIPRNMYILSKC